MEDQNKILRKLQTLQIVQQMRQDEKAIFEVALSAKYMRVQDIEPLVDVLEGLLISTDTVRSLRGRLIFNWSDLAGEKQEADKLPFVRTYLETVSKKFPYWFWFMSKEPFNINLKWIFYCLGKTDWQTEFGREGQEIVVRSFSNKEVTDFMKKYVAGVHELKQKFGLSEKEVEENLKMVENYYHRILSSMDWSQLPKNIFS
jgi:hypothetical protein